MKGCKCTTRLSAVALGVAFGVTSALCMMLFVWAAFYWGTGSAIINQWSEIYPGLAPSVKGIFFGGAWTFIEGFVFGVIFGWIYNLCLCCCKCCCKSSSSVCCKSAETCEHIEKK